MTVLVRSLHCECLYSLYLRLRSHFMDLLLVIS